MGGPDPPEKRGTFDGRLELGITCTIDLSHLWTHLTGLNQYHASRDAQHPRQSASAAMKGDVVDTGGDAAYCQSTLDTCFSCSVAHT